MTSDERDLLHRHLNGDLSAAEQATFFARLGTSPELRRALATEAFDETLLSELVLEGRRSARPAPRRRNWMPVAVAAAMLIGLTLVLTLGRGNPSRLHLMNAHGDLILRRGGAAIPLVPDLRDGDELQTTASAAFLSGDGVRIEIERRSTLALHSKGVTLQQGAIRTIVQAGSEMRLGAGEAGVVARACTVRMELAGDRIRVEAEAGTVEVVHGGRPTTLSEGRYASIGATVETGRWVSRSAVDAAVQNACRFLESRRSDLVTPMVSEKRHGAAPRRTYAELALLALHRAGIPDAHPLKADLLGQVRGRSIDSTYAAALQAMALAEIDPVAHRERIRFCAQILADSQCANGQWDYGATLALPDVPPTGRIKRRSEGPPSGDNSVTSYAVLALHACARAGVEVETSIVDRARAWLIQCQNADGGWGYNDSGDRSLNKEGDKRDNTSNGSYGSATASAVASLGAIVDLRGGAFSGDSGISRGIDWLAANFAVDRNPGKIPGFAHLHWLISAGRAGQLLGTERFGTHEWYAEGAGYLLSTQHPNGGWTVEQGVFMKSEKNDVLDTCLAILFLKRGGR